MTEYTTYLSSDSPLTHPREDELGYAQFAEHLARAITRMAPRNGIVMAINGPWGSGKSTVLNFIDHFLNRGESVDKPIVVRFNPWWYSSREDLTRLFMSQLLVSLGNKDYRELKKLLADLSDIISSIPAIPGGKLGEILASRLRSRLDVATLKGKIGDLLLAKKKKIVVFIDDIDRLAPDEIQDLFRMVKAVANFPNVIYILAYDTQVVTQALENGFAVSGKAYLEKIVQVPFELPLPDSVSIRKMLFSKLDQVLASTSKDLFDPIYWTNVYFEGIDPFIKTPREVVRLTNALQTTYPAVQEDVNPVDFIAIESLRVFVPEIYNLVRKNEQLVVGTSSGSLGMPNSSERKKTYENWLGEVPDEKRETLIRLLTRLFPKFAASYSNVHYGADFLSTWRKKLRVCSPDIFPIYFRFDVSSDHVSANEIKCLLAESNDTKAFSAQLLNFSSQVRNDGTTRARDVLERLQDYTNEDIPLENIPSIVRAFLNVGDQLLKKEDEGPGMFGFGNDIRIGRILRQLLMRIEQKDRFELLKNAINNGDSLSMAVREVTIFGQEHGKFGVENPIQESDRTINEKQLEDLENITLQKIRHAAQTGSLLQTPELVSVLHRWRTWSNNDEEVKSFVSNIIDDDDKLLDLLVHFGRTQQSHIITDVAVKKQYRLNPKWIEPFISSDDIFGRVQSLAEKAKLTDEQRMAVSQFTTEYEILKSGNNPDELLE